MKKAVTVLLEDEQIKWISDAIHSGRYSSFGHAIRTAVKKLMEREQN